MIILAGGLLYFIANFLSDRVGRRRVFRTSIVLGVFGFALLMWSPHLAVSISGLTLVALMVDICNSLAFIYMSEVSPPKLRNMSSLAMLVGSIIGEIVGSGSALIFSDYRYMSILYFSAIIPVFVFYFWLRPTFFHLVRSKNRKSMFEEIKYVLRTNCVRSEYIKARLHKNQLTLSGETSLNSSSETLRTLSHQSGPSGHSERSKNSDYFGRESSKSVTISDATTDSFKLAGGSEQFELTPADLDPLFEEPAKKDKNFIPLREYFKSCEHLMHLFAYAMLVMNVFWVKGMTVFLPEKMGFDSIYLNNFLLSTADLVGILLMVCFLNSTRRSTLNRFHLGFILAGSITVMVLHVTALRLSLWVQIVDIVLSCKDKLGSNQQAASACAILSRLDSS